jgi:hypothetical protein
MLKMTLEIVVRGKTITVDDWWQLLWEGVPYHGTPRWRVKRERLCVFGVVEDLRGMPGFLHDILYFL